MDNQKKRCKCVLSLILSSEKGKIRIGKNVIGFFATPESVSLTIANKTIELDENILSELNDSKYLILIVSVKKDHLHIPILDFHLAPNTQIDKLGLDLSKIPHSHISPKGAIHRI